MIALATGAQRPATGKDMNKKRNVSWIQPVLKLCAVTLFIYTQELGDFLCWLSSPQGGNLTLLHFWCTGPRESQRLTTVRRKCELLFILAKCLKWRKKKILDIKFLFFWIIICGVLNLYYATQSHCT